MITLAMRHAESIKNNTDIIGGNGGELSINGARELEGIEKRIDFSSLIKPCKVVGGTSLHILRTGEYIGKTLGMNTKWYADLNGINLGVLHGLSADEAKIKHAKSYQLLELWSRGEIGISELHIENMEKFEDFKNRVLRVIGELSRHNKSVVIVGSRSVLILLKNVSELGRDFEISLYRSYDFDYLVPELWHLN